jgi:hypothetical protein
MAKMMMGQIDHARNRVAELKKAKLGDRPKTPDLKGAGDILKALREGSVTVTGPQLRKAFDAYILQDESKQVHEQSGNYSNNYTSTYSLKKSAPQSVEAALATVIYIKENTAEVSRFEQETELFNLNQEALNLKASEVEDAIVLGDQHAALAALNDFAAYEV